MGCRKQNWTECVKLLIRLVTVVVCTVLVMEQMCIFANISLQNYEYESIVTIVIRLWVVQFLCEQENFLFFRSSFWYAVVQLVEALRCKPEGRGFVSRWVHWDFSLI
jgi:hypothetical protein